MKRKQTLFLTVILLCAVLCWGCGDDEEIVTKDTPEKITPAKIVAKTGDYYLAHSNALKAGESDWTVFALARSGKEIPQDFLDDYLADLENLVVVNNGVIPDAYPSEYARLALTVTALGGDPHNVGGFDLFAPLNNSEEVLAQGINGPSWALIAAKGCNATVPEDVYLKAILDAQRADGGFSIVSSGDSDVDITAMMLQALSFYADDPTVRPAIDAAVDFLGDVQEDDGGFTTMGAASLESSAQVLTALAGLGIAADDDRFVKNGHSAFDGFAAYYLDDATFCHILEQPSADVMATEQGFYASVAMDRQEKGKPFLYDLSDMK